MEHCEACTTRKIVFWMLTGLIVGTSGYIAEVYASAGHSAKRDVAIAEVSLTQKHVIASVAKNTAIMQEVKDVVDDMRHQNAERNYILGALLESAKQNNLNPGRRTP